MIQEKTHDLILQLKQIREERELSYQNVIDMVEASGGYTSLSTVRRVFAPDSENKNFRYDDSIKPLVVALLGINDPPQEGTDAEQHEIEALKTVISLKDFLNKELVAENERVKSDYEKKLDYVKDEVQRKHEHILALTEQSDGYIKQLGRKDHVIFLLASCLIALLVLICVALIVDTLRSDIGYIRGLSWGTPVSWVIVAVTAVLSVIVYRVAKHAAKK